MGKNIGSTVAVILLAVVTVVNAFGQKSTTPNTLSGNPHSSQTKAPQLARDLSSLIMALRRGGAAVKRRGGVSQPFLSAAGSELSVNGEPVQVFSYRTAAKANADARKVGPNGSPVGTTMVTWIAPPHFFKNGRLVVIYVGENQEVLDKLKGALGPQFAGR